MEHQELERLQPANSADESLKRHIPHGLLVLMGIIFLIAMFFLIFDGPSNSVPALKIADQEVVNEPETRKDVFSLEGTLEVRDGFIYAVRDDREVAIFSQVAPEVVEVAIGPDKKTVHFLFSDISAAEFLDRCAVVESWPEQPHVFGEIGAVYGAQSCGGSGYIGDSKLFAYMEQQDKELVLVIKDMEANDIIFEGPLLNNLGHLNTQYVLDLAGSSARSTQANSARYYYPRLSAVWENEGMLLAFGEKLLIEVDFEHGVQGIASIPGEVVYNNAQVAFYYRPVSPFVLISHLSPIAVADLSSSRLRVYDVIEMSIGATNKSIDEFATWSAKSLFLKGYEHTNITDKIDERFDLGRFHQPNVSKEELDSLEAAIVRQLESLNLFPEIHCDLGSDISGNTCYGVAPSTSLEFTVP